MFSWWLPDHSRASPVGDAWKLPWPKSSTKLRLLPTRMASASWHLGVLLICIMTYRMISDPTTVVQGLDEMLRR